MTPAPESPRPVTAADDDAAASAGAPEAVTAPPAGDPAPTSPAEPDRAAQAAEPAAEPGPTAQAVEPTAEPGPTADAAPGATPDPDPAPVTPPAPGTTDAEAGPAGRYPPRPRVDAVTLWVAVALPALAIAGTMVARTWLTFALLMLAPFIGIVYGLGLLVLVRVLRRRSMVRREMAGVPRRYIVLGWAWAVAFALASLSPAVGTADGSWLVPAAFLGVSAIAVGVLTFMLWSAYLADKAWIDSPHRED